MKKLVLRGLAGIAMLALLFFNVNVVLNGKQNAHFQLSSADKVLADESSGSGSAILGVKTYVPYTVNNVQVSVVGYFNTVTGGSGTQSSESVAASLQAQNPNLSGAQLQAAVNAQMASTASGWGASSGGINTFNVAIQQTLCPGYGGICSTESGMDAELRVIYDIRNNIKPN